MRNSPTIFDRIRRACRTVVDRARDVAIDEPRLRDFADTLSVESLTDGAMDDELHWTGRGDETIAYIVVLDSINFGSGYFGELRPVDGNTEYELVARRLRQRFEQSGPCTAGELSAATPSDCARLFGQALDEPGPRELMTLFSASLRQLGDFIQTRYDGSFSALLEDADHRAERLVELLGSMPMFQDVTDYDGHTVSFYKRAQITAADLHLAFEGTGPGRFDDIDELTMFADNQVPHVLRTAGALRYSKTLADHIDRGELLEAGSRPEVEIRACALHAVERLAAILRKSGIETSPRLVDRHLWGLGETPVYRNRPRHRTKTPAY